VCGSDKESSNFKQTLAKEFSSKKLQPELLSSEQQQN